MTDRWEPVFRPMSITADARRSRDVEAILMGTAPQVQIGMRRVGDDSEDDVASQLA